MGQQALVTPFPYRYTAASALLIALLNHAVYYVTSSALGVLGLARLGLSLRAARGTEADVVRDSARSALWVTWRGGSHSGQVGVYRRSGGVG